MLNITSTTLASYEQYLQIKPRWTTAVYLVSDDRTQELGLTLLGRVPMPASYPHLALA